VKQRDLSELISWMHSPPLGVDAYLGFAFEHDEEPVTLISLAHDAGALGH